MELQTKVKLPEDGFRFSHRDTMLVMGSCFAEEIGQWLELCKFSCRVNPYGVLYNPMSILAALKDIEKGRMYSAADLFRYGGLWHSWMHHSSFSSPSPDETVRNINTAVRNVRAYWKNLQWLILTWGTSHASYLIPGTGLSEDDSEKLVANCHKVPQTNFEERIFSVEQISDAYSEWLEAHPGLKVLMTVSPIRYRKYGFHESNLSKATLLLAQAELCRRFPERCFYFPAYEILMDELRDYRFYAADMLHPSDTAVAYIREYFSKSYFSTETQSINRECESLAKALNHRPLHPDTDVYQCFLSKIVLRIQALQEKYPYLSGKFENELRLCRTLLKQ